MEHAENPSPTVEAEHIALRAQHYDEAKALGLLLVRIDPKTIRAKSFPTQEAIAAETGQSKPEV
jgi:hypothetical protein